MMTIKKIIDSYALWRVKGIDDRYFSTEMLDNVLADLSSTKTIVGRSFKGKPIYKVRIGKGKIKVLLWSQMHGNESTATRAMLDLLNLFNKEKSLSQSLLEHMTIDYIPQLNPDGADAYTRRNAMQLDINRDYNQSATPEMRTIKELVTANVYKCLFNLHDQRTIFSVTNVNKPATLSFLSPVISSKRELTTNREYAMSIIIEMISNLSEFTKVNIAKFTDEYYPNATGDNFQKLFPTILIESGHSPNDYDRNKTREFTAFAILFGLLGLTKDLDHKKSIADYNKIPVNEQRALDIIYKNIAISNNNEKYITDLGIQYEEVLNKKENKIDFVAKIHEIGDLSHSFGHDIYHAENRVFDSSTGNVPKIGEKANFTLSDWNIVNGKIGK